ICYLTWPRRPGFQYLMKNKNYIDELMTKVCSSASSSGGSPYFVSSVYLSLARHRLGHHSLKIGRFEMSKLQGRVS
ncbi:hypothetical protein ACFL27_23855, partial [candidate division CSSED10-310 bacterium]